MATKLEKDITRESTVKVEDRELLVTLTADQKVSMKPKGLGVANTLDIGIEELYKSLTPVDNEEEAPKARGINKSYSDDLMISIGELRAQMMVADISYEDKVMFSNFVRDVITSVKRRQEMKKK
jgi:hypothetical protein